LHALRPSTQKLGSDISSSVNLPAYHPNNPSPPSELEVKQEALVELALVAATEQKVVSMCP